jgi:N-acetylmuramoyl-L-alanine amidase
MAPSALASRKAAADDAEFTYRPRPSTESDSSEVTDRDSSRQAASPDAARPGTLTRALGLKIGRIVIDPGHGGHDTGTIGPHGLCEKDLVLDVGLRLKKLIQEELGANVVMTRGDDTFVPLEERTAIANQKAADLFISIHANASRDENARGIETYYLNLTSNPQALEVAARENATSQESVHQLQSLIKKIALTEKVKESQDFAQQVQREIYARVQKAGGGQENRGVKRAPFVVLIGANMPSILAEVSFLTNPRDEKLLRRPEYRQKIAEALCHGVLRYSEALGGLNIAQRSRAPMVNRIHAPALESSENHASSSQ